MIQWDWDKAARGEWEPYTFSVLNLMLSPEVPYLDLGAWIGPTVLYACYRSERNYAVEPDPEACKQLVSLLTLNDITNVKVFPLAISDHNGTIRMGSEALGNSMTRRGDLRNQFHVPCQTLEVFMQEHGLGSETFIKMDIEGGEEEVLFSHVFDDLQPTLYVSLHPRLWKDEKSFKKRFNDLVGSYRHSYGIEDENGDVRDNFLFTNREVNGKAA